MTEEERPQSVKAPPWTLFSEMVVPEAVAETKPPAVELIALASEDVMLEAVEQAP